MISLMCTKNSTHERRFSSLNNEGHIQGQIAQRPLYRYSKDAASIVDYVKINTNVKWRSELCK